MSNELNGDVFENLPKNAEIVESYLIANDKIRRFPTGKIMVSLSGGADSDIVCDIVCKINKDVNFVFFDTGIEYMATKTHLSYLESKYGIRIEREKAVVPVPLGCKKYGLPFLSKQVSENIERLQRHGFEWEDEPLEILLKKYPRCKSALRWWCNDKTEPLNISHNKWLKEFLVENPPSFKISSKCCHGAKKEVAKKYHKTHDIKLDIVGIRKAEGGARSSLPNCFTERPDSVSQYRPIFWYKKETKSEYDKYYKITHSDCYTVYGLERTGCAGCPFGRDFEKELEIIRHFEPKLYAATNKIFGESYDYTRKYRDFVKIKNAETNDGQLTFFEEAKNES